jgi:hypothetical protein
VHLARFRRRLLLTFVVPFVVMLAATPSSWFSRFTVLFVAPGAVALPFMVERIRQRALVVILHLATVIVVVIGCVRPADRVTVAGKVFSPSDVLSRAGDPASSRTLDQLVLPAYAWANRLPRGSRVAVLPSDIPTFFAFPWVYQLFGADFRNRVVALDARDVEADALEPALRRRGADHLVTWSGTETDAIAKSHPEVFVPVSSVEGVDVYRVVGARTARPPGAAEATTTTSPRGSAP